MAYRYFSYGLRLLACMLPMGVPRWALTEPVEVIRSNGNSANRVDLAIVGDGYIAGELDNYATDAESVVQGIFSQEPFREYQNYFNVHRIDVVSQQSGADHPESGVFVDTTFDATYNCGGIQRLICVDTTKVDLVIGRSAIEPTMRDMVLVIVNDPEYGGSGGAVAVASTHPAVVELVLHESGHSFGLLADEYDSSPPACANAVEPPEPNATIQTARDLIKWNRSGGPPQGWIALDTEVPTAGSVPGLPGLYQGARYCVSGMYRPTFNSKMRSLGFPFEQINEEQLVKRIYNLVSPLDSSRPRATRLVLQQGVNRGFQVSVPKPLTHLLKIHWSVDGVGKGKGRTFTLDSGSLSPGDHTVKVTVQDPTVKVRTDPANVLKEHRTWKVRVRP